MKKIFFSVILSALVFAFPKVIMAQIAAWTKVDSPVTTNLFGVAFTSPDVWVAVGNDGVIIRSADGGNTWNSITSPVADALRAVSFLGNTGLAAGISGRVLRTEDSGLSWTEMPRPTTRNLYAVSMGPVMTVMTGEEGTILVSYDEGLTWEPHTAGTASILFGVSVSGNSAIGAGGQATLVNSVDGGAGWGLEVLGNPLTLFFYGASLPNGTIGYAVGINGSNSVILKTENTGFTYTLSPYSGSATFFGVSFSSPDTGTVVGSSGTIVQTLNGGQAWETQESGTFQSLNGVAFQNAFTGVAVGDSGIILKAGELNSIGEVEGNAGSNGIHLEQNQPNPVISITHFRFSLASPGQVTLILYNSMGKEVLTILDKELQAGNHEVNWSPDNIANGIYFYRLQSGMYGETRKLILMRS